MSKHLGKTPPDNKTLSPFNDQETLLPLITPLSQQGQQNPLPGRMKNV